MFGSYIPEVKVINFDEYKEIYSKIIPSSKYKNAFVFNPDLLSILKTPFKKGYKKGDFIFEQTFLNACIDLQEDIDKVNNDPKTSLGEICNNKIKLFFNVLKTVDEKIDSGEIKHIEGVEQEIKGDFSKFGMGVKINENRLNELFLNRFNYDLKARFFSSALF